MLVCDKTTRGYLCLNARTLVNENFTRLGDIGTAEAGLVVESGRAAARTRPLPRAELMQLLDLQKMRP